MSNFMTGFMRGYGFVDDEMDESRLEKQQAEDRERRLSRQETLRGREDQLWERQTKALNDADKAKNLDAARYLLKDEGFEKRLSERDPEAVKQLEGLLGEDERAQKFLKSFSTPEKLKQGQEDILTLEKAFKGKASKDEAIKASNRLLKPFLDYGDGGKSKQIADIFPSKSGKGLYAELEMDEGGKKKRAPLTTNRSKDDKEVKEIPMDRLMKSIGMLKQHINSQLVSLGDTSPIEARNAKLTRQQEREDARAERLRELGDTASERQFKMDKMITEYALKAQNAQLKGGAAGGAYGLSVKDFSSELNRLEALGKRKSSIQQGYDPLTDKVITPENKDAALATVNKLIAERERFIKNVAPDLWPLYRRTKLENIYGRPAAKGEIEAGTGRESEAFSAGARPDRPPEADPQAESQQVTVPPPREQPQPSDDVARAGFGVGSTADPQAAPSRLTRGTAPSGRGAMGYSSNISAFSPENNSSTDVSKYSRPDEEAAADLWMRQLEGLPRTEQIAKLEQWKEGGRLRDSVATVIESRLGGDDPVETRVYNIIQAPTAPGAQEPPEVNVVRRFAEWAKQKGMKPNGQALEAFAQEAPDVAEVVKNILEKA